MAKLSWTQSCCGPCWDERNPNRPSFKMQNSGHDTCCHCGVLHESGIYVRIDPSTVRFPMTVEKE